MKITNIFEVLSQRLFSKWVVCKLISDKESVKYGMYFSYPTYILLVLFGIVSENPLLIAIAALVAFLAIKLPLHPFDYVYNYSIANFLGLKKITDRGSELQVNSFITLCFNLTVLAIMLLNVPIDYAILALIYAMSSIFFIGIFLFKE